MNKQETIRAISDLNSLNSLIFKIANLSELKDVTKVSEYIITAIEKTPLRESRIVFISTLSELQGKVQKILDLINENCSEGDQIIVVTSHKKKVSNYFKDWLKKEVKTDKLDFWSESELILHIDKFIPEYWGHNDLFLKTYEDSFIKSISEDVDLKRILKLDKKFEGLLNVFIEPKIFYIKEDKKSDRKVRVKLNIDKFLGNQNFFISGDAGTGKSTLLKEIGKKIVDNNKNSVDKVLPIILKSSFIAYNEFSIKKSINSFLSKEFSDNDIKKIFNDYNVRILIDSIDEFEREHQKIVFKELLELENSENAKFIICTRNYDNLTKDCEICCHTHTFLSNFDQTQVKQYLDNFFKFDLTKSEKLWESLLDNKILERIPSTPLTISLVSILYEENGYEVPATLTDVYDNFNIFLLGRLNVESRLEFLEINIKEKILSMYALHIIRTKNRIRMNEKEFIEYVIDFFKKKSITISEELVPELIISITEGTGILYIDDNGYVTFKHDHFMEYYASREIFNLHNRHELEKELVENFTEYNWQNTSIFYAGRTKDMPEFLSQIIKRVYDYHHLHDCLLAISGLGYLLQALWMTDSMVRKDGVIAALELLMLADSRVKELASSKFHFFVGIKNVHIAIMNLVWFYNHFNSIAIRDPLNLAFNQLHLDLKKLEETEFAKDKITRQYQLFCIASTLNTGRNEDPSKLELLFEEDKILNNPLFVYLFDNAIEILEYSNEKKLREDFKVKNKLKKYLKSIRFYLDTPSEELRFTNYENLNPIKKVEIFTEGKTDATIIDKAFKALTYGDEPYWSISSIDKGTNRGGGATELAKHLKHLSTKITTDADKEKTIIGLFDNDEKGFQEFNGLNDNFETINKILKKDKNNKLYALLLPIPEQTEFSQYHQDKQKFKYFAIEHYFNKELLKSENMITPTPINSVFEITGNKNEFAQKILNFNDPKIFKNFISLLREIDSICDIGIEYIE